MSRFLSVISSLFSGDTVQHHFVFFTLVFCSVCYTFVPRGLLVQTPTRVCIKSLVSRKRSPPCTIQQNSHQKELSSTYCHLIASDCEIESHGSSKWVITLVNSLKQSLLNFNELNFTFPTQTLKLMGFIASKKSVILIWQGISFIATDN